MPGTNASSGTRTDGVVSDCESPLSQPGIQVNPSSQATSPQRIFYADGDRKTSPTILAVLQRTGLSVTRFESVDACLTGISRHRCHLVISNSPQPATEAIELLNQVHRVVPWLPVIVLVDRGEVATAVRVIKAGALDCIERPPQSRYLRAAIDAALRQAEQHREPAPLTDVERLVLQHLMRGQTNRQIAKTLQRSQRTIEVHRSDIIRKLGAEGPVDLMRRAAAAGLLDL